ncbi:hypothetical protein O3P69_012224 [Scylla paramamosain]|uniref:PLAC domain-containing protein n=2 Tax=Scylla paramamosain TaxID=85552 RepID=A0AAW0TD79_SCYPA
MNALNMKLMNVTLKVEQLCAATPRPSISQRPQEISGSNLMLTLLHKIETMEETLNQMQRKLSVVENRPTVIMEEEFRPQIPQVYRTTTPRTMTGDERTEQQCVTRQEVEEMLNASVKLVVGSIEEALGQCASEDKVKEVLDEVVEVQEGVEQVAAVTGQAREEAQRCPLEGAALVTQEVAALNGSVHKMEANFVEMTKLLQMSIEEILNFTRLPPPTLPPTTTTTTTTTTHIPTTPTPPGAVYPCEDSTFPGSPGYDVCQAAVRFNRCRLQTVAYHCCHTCTSHNKLPEMGPWRYENASRVVNTLNVLRFFTL